MEDLRAGLFVNHSIAEHGGISAGLYEVPLVVLVPGSLGEEFLCGFETLDGPSKILTVHQSHRFKEGFVCSGAGDGRWFRVRNG